MTFYFNVPFLEPSTIHSRADEIRKFNNDLFPIDPELIAENLGFDLIPLPGLRILTNTEASLVYKEKIIYFDNDAVEVRLKFSFAHELGHYVLHRNILENLKVESLEDWNNVIDSIPQHIYNRFEWQANEFAGRLLVPRDRLESEIKKLKEPIKISKQISNGNYSLLFPFIGQRLANIFGVSEDVMKKRLIKEDINPYDFIK